MPNKQGWDHDGTIYRVYSDDAAVLQTPFGGDTSGAHPVLSRNPTSGLPEWADITIQNTQNIYQVQAPVPTDVPITGPTPTESACGIALYCAGQLVQAYNVASSLFRALIQDVLSIVDGALKTELQDGLGELLGPEAVLSSVALAILLDIFTALVGALLALELAPLSDQAIANVQKALYDVLSGQTTQSTFTFDVSVQTGWDTNIAAHPSAYTSLQLLFLRLLIHYYQPQFWQSAMVVGGLAPSDICPALAYTG